jgi:hypothetical protein
MLGIVDLFDVPFGEKPIIENSIKNNVQIGSPVIIINNQETGNVEIDIYIYDTIITKFSRSL